MAKLRKWNNSTRKYDDYEIPDDWHTPLYTRNSLAINCVQCGTRLNSDDAYTSIEVHNNLGLGYSVCKKCYEEEIKRKKSYEIPSQN